MERQNVKTVRPQEAPSGSPKGGKETVRGVTSYKLQVTGAGRHCERSEAIRNDGIAGQARNDGVASFLYQTLTSFTMTVFALFLFLLLLSSCQPSLPPDIWEKEQMTEFLI